MIDLSKIEAAAKAADCADTVLRRNMILNATANPTTVLELIRMIRERDAVLRQALDFCKNIKCDSLYEQNCSVCSLEEAIQGVLK